MTVGFQIVLVDNEAPVIEFYSYVNKKVTCQRKAWMRDRISEKIG